MKIYQKQLIYGTLLGKSYLSKPKTGVNYFMTMAPVEDENWFNFKCQCLEEYARPSPVSQGYWRSQSNSVWTDLHKSFYNEMNMDSLNQLTGAALAAWFLDKGFFVSKKRICLRTTSFGMAGNKVIKRFFNEVDMPCDIRKERDTGRIVFTKEGTHNFLKIIAPETPPFMYYRLEEKELFYEEMKAKCAEDWEKSLV